MKTYLAMLKDVLENGETREDRTGTGTRSLFGYQNRYDLSKGFPLVTSKKCHLRSIIHELLWFLKGETNVAYLHENKVTIWDEKRLEKERCQGILSVGKGSATQPRLVISSRWKVWNTSV